MPLLHKGGAAVPAASLAGIMFLKEALEIKRSQPDAPGISGLLDRSLGLMAVLYPPESNHSLSAEELSDPTCFFVGAYIKDIPIGCGAVKISADHGYGEIKAVYVLEEYRRKGVSRAIMRELESHLASQNIDTARLETGNKQPEALRLYSKLGYFERGPFGDYSTDPNSIFMEKHVGT